MESNHYIPFYLSYFVEKAVTEIENLYLAMADEDGEREKEVDIKNNSTNSHYLESNFLLHFTTYKWSFCFGKLFGYLK